MKIISNRNPKKSFAACCFGFILSKYSLEGCLIHLLMQNDKDFSNFHIWGGSHPPVLHDPETPWCHAVDAPVGDALVVADRDGESAVVGAHHTDLVVRVLFMRGTLSSPMTPKNPRNTFSVLFCECRYCCHSINAKRCKCFQVSLNTSSTTRIRTSNN